MISISMTPMELLLNRNSQGRLTLPAPDPAELDLMIQAALRAPDHARMTPWRFIMVSGDARAQLGDVFVAAQRRRDAGTAEDKLDKLRANPLRAPLLIVVVARIVDSPKVPAIEQRLSAACAAHSILLAAQAQGFGGMWRTGDMAYDRHVCEALGLLPHEEITGFLYLGTAQGEAKPLPVLNSAAFLSDWRQLTA